MELTLKETSNRPPGQLPVTNRENALPSRLLLPPICHLLISVRSTPFQSTVFLFLPLRDLGSPSKISSYERLKTVDLRTSAWVKGIEFEFEFEKNGSDEK